MSDKQQYPIPTVGGFILNNDNKILLVQCYKWINVETVPGGKVKVGETMAEALKREMKEEVKLDIEIIKPLCTIDAIYPKEYYKKMHFIFNEFLCRAKTDTPKLDNDEIQSYEWVELKEALKKKLDPFTRKTIVEYIMPIIYPN